MLLLLRRQLEMRYVLRIRKDSETNDSQEETLGRMIGLREERAYIGENLLA
jgi:hypothetical protein